MDPKERIHQLLKDSQPVKTLAISLLINILKEKNFSKKETLKAIEQLMKEGEIYICPKSICLIE